jgi:hypothetical protein
MSSQGGRGPGFSSYKVFSSYGGEANGLVETCSASKGLLLIIPFQAASKTCDTV